MESQSERNKRRAGIRADTGRRGERAACDYLRRLGYAIRHTNWRSGRYEIDIVAERPGEIRFVEVKTRRAGGLTTPEDAVNGIKRRAVCTAATHYMALYGVGGEPHIDLAAVDMFPDGSLEVRFIPDAIIP